MEMPTDDELYRVDDVYLGPKGRLLPFRVRYRAYWLGGSFFLALIAGEILTGTLGMFPALYALVATVYLTSKVMRHIDHEMPLRAVAVTAWHEVAAPRPSSARARAAQPDVRRIRRPQCPTLTGTTSPGAS